MSAGREDRNRSTRLGGQGSVDCEDLMGSCNGSIQSSIGADPLPALLASKSVQDRMEHVYGRSSKPRVLIINTGGTLGMKKDETGSLAPAPGYFTSQMLLMEEEVNTESMPCFDIVEYAPLLDSSCFEPTDWERIAVDIGRAYQCYDGFVVCMGTDTMAYAASALSFMLENLGKTVVFTGSQIPFAEVYNDARRNVIVATIMAANQEIPEVCVFFSDRLLRANRTVKVDSLALTAFDSPSFPALGRLGVSMRYRRDLVLPPPRGPFRVHTEMDSRVVVIKLIPGFDDEALLAIARHSSELKAVVLELYGTGNSPSRRERFLEFIQVSKERGILVVAVSQCLRGGVALGTYAVGAALLENGVIPGGDMTTEAVVTKLAYLFGRTGNVENVRQLMEQNLRGELSPASTFAHPLFGGAGKVEVGRHIERAHHESGPLPRL